MVQLQPIESSAIDAAGYDPVSRTLAVRYKGAKATHHYIDVPADLGEGVFSADSPGRFLTANIKQAFAVEKIDDNMPDPASEVT